jgi:hypothetical protein
MPHPLYGKENVPVHEPTPFQDLYKRPSLLYTKLRPCGSLVWVTFGQKPQNKLAPRAQPMAYVGHEGGHKYVLWDGRTIRKARDVSFTEHNWVDYMQEHQQIITAVTQQPSESSILSLSSHPDLEPTSYQAAMASTNAHLWQESMEKEMDAQDKNGTWIEVPRHEAKGKVLTGKWVYKIKDDGTYKSRWVIRGFAQELDSYELTRAAVVQGVTTRILLKLAATYGWSIRTADVKNAFLNGTHAGKPIYMQLPPGFGKPGTVCKLVKSLYGLKTASIQWYIELRDKLEQLGFQTSKHDECLYIKADSNGRTYVTVHVDDLAIYNDSNDEVIPQLTQFFTLHDTKSERYLGLQISRRENSGFHVSQPAYTKAILHEFGDLIRSSNVPISKRAIAQQPGQPAINPGRYKRLIGKLSYLSYNSRPDITFAVIHASSFSINPSQSAWEVLRDILGYLERTSDYGISYNGSEGGLQLDQYSDASFATGTKGRSISGRITLLDGSIIAWNSHQQTSVATSTTHSEYIAAYEAALQVIPLHELLQEMLPSTKLPTPRLLIDNTATLSTTNQGILTRQNRHFVVKYYWLHEQVDEGRLITHWVATDKQVADVLTKPATPGKLKDFISITQLGN